MIEANGLDPERHRHMREQMVELIKIVEGFFACGVAASSMPCGTASGAIMPDPVFANIGKLLLATQIYDMHRIAHEVSGGLIVALPGPDEDHNPATAASLAEALARAPRRALRQADRGRALPRGPDASSPGRLVLGDLAARRRLAGGDEARDLASTIRSAARSSWSSACSAAASSTTPGGRSPPTDSPAAAATRAARRRAGRSWSSCRSGSARRGPNRQNHDLNQPSRATRTAACRRGCDSSRQQMSEVRMSATSYAEFHRRSLEDRDAFWAEQARLVDWERPYDSVCDDSRAPFTRWFAGGDEPVPQRRRPARALSAVPRTR